MAERRALILASVFPPARGGIELTSHRIAAGMSRFEPRVLALDEPGSEEFDRGSGLDLTRVRNEPRGGRRSLARLNLAAMREGWRRPPDVLLSMHVRTGPSAAAIKRSRGVPFVQYVHAKELFGWPRASRLALREAARVIVQSGYSRELALEFGASAERIVHVSPGVELPATAPELPAGRPTLLTISRLEHEYKGHDVVLEALPAIRERVPDVLWAVVGDGPRRQWLAKRAAELGVDDAIALLGSVPDEERDRWLSRADVFAMPSRVPDDRFGGEGFGLVYLEAAAHGLPVVAGDAGGTTDAVRHGETGLLVDPQDPRAVAEAVTTLLLDRGRATQMGEAGRRFAAGFAWPGVVARVEAVLEDAALTR